MIDTSRRRLQIGSAYVDMGGSSRLDSLDRVISDHGQASSVDLRLNPGGCDEIGQRNSFLVVDQIVGTICGCIGLESQYNPAIGKSRDEAPKEVNRDEVCIASAQTSTYAILRRSEYGDLRPKTSGKREDSD